MSSMDAYQSIEAQHRDRVDLRRARVAGAMGWSLLLLSAVVLLLVLVIMYGRGCGCVCAPASQPSPTPTPCQPRLNSE